MLLHEEAFHSRLLDNARTVWLQSPPGNRPAEAVCILLDAEYYVGRTRMDVPTLLAELQSAGTLPPLAIAYVSHIDSPTRWREGFCNESFARFVGEELLPWASDRLGASSCPTVLVGLSLTGLAAAHVPLISPGRFSAIVCQSASFWCSDGWLIEAWRRASAPSCRFRIVCGSRETADFVDHGSGLIQRISQLASNRAMRDVLRDKGADVSYHEFDGGHDLVSWRSDLPDSLLAVLRS